MAEKNRSSEGTVGEKHGEKRRSTGEDGPVTKKIMMNIKSQKVEPKVSLQPTAKPDPPAALKMSLNTQKSKETPSNIVKKSSTVAQAFNSDSEEEEEMPPEAKMRMKNVGRDTPTAAGPNSFGKGKLGFTNHHRLLEKQIEDQASKTD